MRTIENCSDQFLGSEEMTPDELKTVKNGYLRGAFLRDLLITLPALAIVTVLCLKGNLSSPVVAAALIVLSVIALFAVCGVISELVIFGIISKGDFTWRKGTVSRYSVEWYGRTAYIYAEVDNDFCNIFRP